MIRNLFHLRSHMGAVFMIGGTALIWGVGVSTLDTVWAIFLKSIFGSDVAVGYISSFFSLIMFLALIFMVPLMEKYDEIKIWFWAAFYYGLILLIISFFNTVWIILLLACGLAVFKAFQHNSMHIILRRNSKLSELPKSQGVYFALDNIGWLVGPLIGGFAAMVYGISPVFVISGLFVLFSAFVLRSIKLKHKQTIPKKLDLDVISNIEHFTKEIERVKAFLFEFSIRSWWAFIYIFIPLFILENGLSVAEVGIFLALISVPLIIFDYWVGRETQRFGFRKLFVAGFAIIAVCCFTAFLTGNIYIILAALVLASVGGAFVETLTRPYLFNHTEPYKEDLHHPLFCTSIPLGSFFGKFFPATILLFFSYSAAFLGMGLLMIAFLLLALTAKK